MNGSILIHRALAAGLLLAVASSARSQTSAPSEGRTRRGGGNGEVRMPTPAFRTEVPRRPYDLILGRPTRTSVTLSVLAYEAREGFLAYGPRPGRPGHQTPVRSLSAGEPQEWELTGLGADTRYHYVFRSRPVGSQEFTAGSEGTFITARSPGSPFTFTVQADPHLDFGTDPEVYRKSLTNALAARPDFHIDLGDTFMTDKYVKFTDAAPQYLAQRFYLGLIGRSAPIFLVLGNHDGEQPARGGAGPDSMAVWSNTMRKRYFPNPCPDGFYSGNTDRPTHTGLLENYYAWEWGDALFVVLDPFWYSARQRRDAGDNWGRTLGEAQYRWLAKTLGTSTARFKFVFIHHLAGGETPEGRGGATVSHLFEWGGREMDGRDTFARRRPGWPAPIHDLLVKHGASIVFHGHDHLYVREERDGIIYQEVPQPGHSRPDNTSSAAGYGYLGGVIQGNSGILRVSVSPDSALVEYVRAYPSSAETAGRRTGDVTHSYRIAPPTIEKGGRPRP